MDVDDLQLQRFVGPLVVVRNAASARSCRLEADFRWLTPRRLLGVQAAGSITDARFIDYPDAPAPRGAESASQDLSGRRLPFVPKRQLTVTPTLRIPLPPAPPVVAAFLPGPLAPTTALDVAYRSSIHLDGDLDPQALQEANTLVSGRVVLFGLDERLSLSLAGTNLTDAGVADFVADDPLFPGGFHVRQETQRSFSVELRYAW